MSCKPWVTPGPRRSCRVICPSSAPSKEGSTGADASTWKPEATRPGPDAVDMPKVKKQKTVLAKSPPVKPARSAHQPQKQVSSHIKRLPLQTWTCSSIIDQQSAEAVARLLAAAETRTSGATIKSLTLAPHIVHKKPTFAVTCETLKHLPLLQQLLHKIDLLAQHENQVRFRTSSVFTASAAYRT